MLRRRIINFRVVKESDNPTDNKEEKDILTTEMEEDIKAHRKKVRRRIMAVAFAITVAVVLVFLIIYLQTYTKVRISDTYSIGNAADNNYLEFAGGVLKYSRDGISYLNQKGEEIWNRPYQFKTPFLSVNHKSAVVADKGGNDIIVFQRDGVKGEIHTALPIEKIAVSKQGIVGALLKNESNPRIICYDTMGNILVEHQASLTGTGYPMDISLSEDGELMQVVYLAVENGEMISRVCYYNFGDAGKEKQNHQVMEKEYSGSIIASGFFINESVSAVVGDNCLTLFDGKAVPEEQATISVEGEIQSVFHGDRYIGLVVKNEGVDGYELCLYNKYGRKVLSENISGTYKSAKISGSQVILYDGKNCNIYMRTGIHRFEGEMDNNILEIFPVGGVNKYIVMNANGMENVRLVK